MVNVLQTISNGRNTLNCRFIPFNRNNMKKLIIIFFLATCFASVNAYT